MSGWVRANFVAARHSGEGARNGRDSGRPNAQNQVLSYAFGFPQPMVRPLMDSLLSPHGFR
jgi:hypothetical protein